MEIVTLSILLIGIVFVLMGYIELFYNEKKEETVVEYRFIPRDVYDNIESNDLVDQFSFMFDAGDVRFNTNLV
jgi:hypothetical protein|tara:strand:- start:348 stop:566 length:219 start_codon:yes stop_codon:yes gene_type:complete